MSVSTAIRISLLSIATILCTSPLSASPGAPIFRRPNQQAYPSYPTHMQSSYPRHIAQSTSEYNYDTSVQYNPYSADETDENFNNADPLYDQDGGDGGNVYNEYTGGYGAAAAVGAGVEAAHRNQDRVAAEEAARHRRERDEQTGRDNRAAEGGASSAGFNAHEGQEHREGQDRREGGMGHSEFRGGGREMGGHGGRR